MNESLSIETLEKALVTLKSSLMAPPRNDLERDGVIQRFEYTFEMSWKMIRKTLLHMGRLEVSNSPKPLFKSAFEEGLISDLNDWLDFVDARNKTSHDYSLTKATYVYDAAKRFPPFVDQLIIQLKSRLS